jgi:uncharacterized protein (DUF1697 family)
MNYIALLRGINVGGKNTISMAQLKIACEEIGLKNVRTYINSGNILFESDEPTDKLTKKIQKVLSLKFKLDTELLKVLILSHDRLQKVMNQAPKGFGSEPDKYHSDVIFLIDIDSSDAFKIFNPREGVDKVWQGDMAIYSQRLSELRTKSRLSKIMASPLYKSMTIRTTDTVKKLLSLSSGE